MARTQAWAPIWTASHGLPSGGVQDKSRSLTASTVMPCKITVAAMSMRLAISAFLCPDSCMPSELLDFGDRTSSEVVASLAPGASVVKAFNHVPFMRLLSPLPDDEQHVLFVSGDDAAAKAGLRSVLEANNFAVIDLGGLATGSHLQQVGGPFGGLDLRLSAG